MKTFYNAWNADGQKNLQVIVISGDRDADGFKNSMANMPWVALPLKSSEAAILAAKVPCTGYPTPGIINGLTGEVIDADVFGKVAMESLAGWLAKC